MLRVAVVGAGLMGRGIAKLLAARAATVTAYDPSAEALARLDPRVKAEPDLAMAVCDAEIVFEAAPEDLVLKQDLFRRLDETAPATAILATNTSAIRVGEIAALTRRPDRVVGTHWWYPPDLLPLVEVVQGPATSGTTVSTTMALLRAAGKTPVHVRRDVPGFIGNRLQHALIRQAFELVDAGVCDAEAIDLVVKLGFGRRLAVLGPMENADLVGLDLALAVHEYLLPTLDPPSPPAAGLRKRVAAGRLGVKTGSGFREWREGEAEALRARLVAHLARLANEDGS